MALSPEEQITNFTVPPRAPAMPPDIAQLEAVGRGALSPAQLGFGPGAAPAFAPASARAGLAGLPPPPAAAAMPAAAAPPTAAAPRYLSDEQIARMGPEDVYGTVINQNLTDADRLALSDRLSQLQQQQSAATPF